MKPALLLLSTLLSLQAQDDLSSQILTIKRVYVDRLTGGETAAQMRDLLISSLQGSKLFILTENQDRADVFIRHDFQCLVNRHLRRNGADANSFVVENRANSISQSHHDLRVNHIPPRAGVKGVDAV